MHALKIAAFCAGEQGGNPAGVVLAAELPSEALMQGMAAEVGFSETVFAAPLATGWRVRYFSPAAEIPFCGHATIALGAALASQQGPGRFALVLNHAEIEVEGYRDADQWAASLWSPPTRSAPLSQGMVAAVTALFGYDPIELAPQLPPARIHAGADHLFLALRDRAALKAMRYDFQAGCAFMREVGVATILWASVDHPRRFRVRNAFAFGGVYEDPAAGASAAALGGYLRDMAWPHGGAIDLHQGDDMGVPCRLHVEIGATQGSPIRLSGVARFMDAR